MDILILVLVYSLPMRLVSMISTQHVEHGRVLPLPPQEINWEAGLKEATYQALAREQIPDPNLRDAIYATPIDGYQNAATPFGDVAVLARGQLYVTAYGYQFVQDPYQNDCDDCHNNAYRCDRQQCEPHAGEALHNLLALWTVKRIRHRDPVTGHRYELQYIISPMSPAGDAAFVTRNGRFDYTIPGHVFIVKLKANGATSDFHSERTHHKYRNRHKSVYYTPPPHQSHTPNTIATNTHKQKILTDHGYNPGFYILHPAVEDKPPVKHYHHHFYIPEVTDIDYNTKMAKPLLPTLPADIPHKIYLTPETTQLTTNQGYVYTTLKYPETTVPVAIFTDLKLFTVPTPTEPTPINPSPFYVQYSPPDPTYHNNEPPTVSTQATAPTFLQTATTTSSTEETKPPTFPDSINVQLPPPDKGTDTTIPYVASTALTIITSPTSAPNTLQTTTHTQTEPATQHKDYEDNIETTPTEPTTPSTELRATTEISTPTIEQTEEIFTPLYTLQTTKSQDFDIFGDVKPKETTTELPKTTKLIPILNKPNAFDDIFGDFKPSTTAQKRVTPRTTQPVDKLKNARLSKYLKYKRNKSNRLSSRGPEKPTEPSVESNGIETKTSQSFITSISFKVNKNERSSTTTLPDFTVPDGDQDSTNATTTEMFENIAQSLVNHARVASYLNDKSPKDE